MKFQGREFVDAAQIPGVVMMNGQPYGETGGHWFPVKGAIRCGTGFVPVLDIPMMDEQPSRKAAGA